MIVNKCSKLMMRYISSINSFSNSNSKGRWRPGEARGGQGRPGEARRGQERPGEARRGQERPGKARGGQEKPGSRGPLLGGPYDSPRNVQRWSKLVY